MLGPLARSRAFTGAVALTTLAVAGVVFASGTSATSGRTPAARTAAPFVGPVVTVPAPQPLVRTDGPLLPELALTRRAGLSPVRPPMGPFAEPTEAAAPVAVAEVGPGSPVPLVRAVQRRLNARGAALRVDGAWGPATTAAVRRLQRQLGLPVDGRLGPATAVALLG